MPGSTRRTGQPGHAAHARRHATCRRTGPKPPNSGERQQWHRPKSRPVDPSLACYKRTGGQIPAQPPPGKSPLGAEGLFQGDPACWAPPSEALSSLTEANASGKIPASPRINPRRVYAASPHRLSPKLVLLDVRPKSHAPFSRHLGSSRPAQSGFPHYHHRPDPGCSTLKLMHLHPDPLTPSLSGRYNHHDGHLRQRGKLVPGINPNYPKPP